MFNRVPCLCHLDARRTACPRCMNQRGFQTGPVSSGPEAGSSESPANSLPTHNPVASLRLCSPPFTQLFLVSVFCHLFLSNWPSSGVLHSHGPETSTIGRFPDPESSGLGFQKPSREFCGAGREIFLSPFPFWVVGVGSEVSLSGGVSRLRAHEFESSSVFSF